MEDSSARLLRVRDGDLNIRFSRSRSDWAILIDTEIDMSQPAADMVGRTTAAEDGSTEVVLEGSPSPISLERPDGKGMAAAADQPGDISSIVAGEIRIEPLHLQFDDCRIVEGKRCVPDILRAAGATGVADMR